MTSRVKEILPNADVARSLPLLPGVVGEAMLDRDTLAETLATLGLDDREPEFVL